MSLDSSREHDRPPMPHAIFFRGGDAIHGARAIAALGRAASHGCVRLASQNALKLNVMVQRDGVRVAIVDSPPSSAIGSQASTTRLAKSANGEPPVAKAQTPHRVVEAERLSLQNPPRVCADPRARARIRSAATAAQVAARTPGEPAPSWWKRLARLREPRPSEGVNGAKN